MTDATIATATAQGDDGLEQRRAMEELDDMLRQQFGAKTMQEYAQWVADSAQSDGDNDKVARKAAEACAGPVSSGARVSKAQNETLPSSGQSSSADQEERSDLKIIEVDGKRRISFSVDNESDRPSKRNAFEESDGGSAVPTTQAERKPDLYPLVGKAKNRAKPIRIVRGHSYIAQLNEASSRLLWPSPEYYVESKYSLGGIEVHRADIFFGVCMNRVGLDPSYRPTKQESKEVAARRALESFLNYED